jgi:hypothetical protein
MYDFFIHPKRLKFLLFITFSCLHSTVNTVRVFSKLHIQFIQRYTHCKTPRSLIMKQHKEKQNYCVGVHLNATGLMLLVFITNFHR